MTACPPLVASPFTYLVAADNEPVTDSYEARGRTDCPRRCRAAPVSDPDSNPRSRQSGENVASAFLTLVFPAALITIVTSIS